MLAGKRDISTVLSWFDWEFWHGSVGFKFRRLNSWRGEVNEVAEPEDQPMNNIDNDND